MTIASMTSGLQSLLRFAPIAPDHIAGKALSQVTPYKDAQTLVASFLPQDVACTFLSASSSSPLAQNSGRYYFTPLGENGVVRGFELGYKRFQNGLVKIDFATRLALVDGCEVEQKRRLEVNGTNVTWTNNVLTFLLNAKYVEDAVGAMFLSSCFPFSHYSELLQACEQGKMKPNVALLLASLLYSPTFFPDICLELSVNTTWHNLVYHDDRFALAPSSKLKLRGKNKFIALRNGEQGQNGVEVSLSYEAKALYVFHNIFEPAEPMLVLSEQQAAEAVGPFSLPAQFLLSRFLMWAETRKNDS